MVNMSMIRAREHLELINCLACAVQGKDGIRFREGLINIAFADDPIARATAVEALTRG